MPTKISRYCEGLMEAAWLAAIVLVPVFFNIYSSRIFEPDKIAILRSFSLIVLGAWVVKIIETGNIRWSHANPGESPLKTILNLPLIIPVLALAGMYIIATIFSVTPRISLWGSYQRLQGLYTTFSYLVIFAALLGNLRRRSQVDRLVSTLIVVSLPVSLYGFLQKYKIDPIPWGGDVSYRIASNLGNSIFVSAYLIMVFPLTMGRIIEAFQDIWKEKKPLSAHVARATVYIFIAAVQLIAMYMSQSRGPVLGLFGGIFFMLLLLAWLWRKPWITWASLSVAVLVALFLGIFNIPNGPLQVLAKSPFIGRFSLLLNAESNSALVRKYIWEGTVKLVSPHDPLKFPDSTTDQFNAIRPIIGYGPESMYVAFNPFYVPELGQVEKRNASPDRAHNETWDSIVNTGVVGMVIELVIYLLVFYYGFRWLGLITQPWQRSLFFILCAVGGLLGSLILSLWRGVEYIALGLPLGLVGGLILFLMIASLTSRETEPLPEGESARRLVMVVLLVAILSHFLEINFGISIAVTNLYFWIYSALLILIGFLLPRDGEYGVIIPGAEGSEANAAGKFTNGVETKVVVQGGTRSQLQSSRAKRARRTERGSQVSARPGFTWLSAFMPEGAITGLLMMTLGYNYISNFNRLTSIPGIIWSSFTILPNHNNAFSPGILALFFTTWIGVSVVFAAEKYKENTNGGGKSLLSYLGPVLVISGTIALIYWIWQAGILASVANMVPESLLDLELQVGRIGFLLTSFFFLSILLVFGLAWFLQGEKTSRNRASIAGPVVGITLLLVAFWIIYFTNLRVIHADVVYKMADPYNKQGQWPVATELYKYANQLAPDQDYYYLFLGRSYLEQAKEETDPTTQAQLVNSAEADLKVAQKINPLNTDHTANLGRLFSWWATRTNDKNQRLSRGKIASDYYMTALSLSPQNSTLWGEWAVLNMEVLDQPQEAYRLLQHALSLDSKYNWTQGLLGDYYFRLGKTISDTVQRDDYFEKALVNYQSAYDLTSNADPESKRGYRVSQGNVYIEMGKLDDAVQAFEQVIALAPDSGDNWRIEEQIARLLLTKGDKQNALTHANEALTEAPKDQSDRLTKLVNEIKGSSQ